MIGAIITILTPLDKETFDLFLEIYGRTAMRWEVQIVRENYGETTTNF